MLSAGQSFQRYHLVRLIGKGGMGEVYLAEDERIRRQVALKVIRVEESQSDEETQETLRLFLREVTAIARLDHPTILPLYDYGEETIDGVQYAYLIMPYRAAGALTSWLRQYMQGVERRTLTLTLYQVAHITGQAADALQYAHDHQVIHQDVKPANFLIRGIEDEIYPLLQLADFGIARLTGTTSHASQHVRGTPAYMAPEQWAGQAVFASDQYALAVMTYELATGRAPFRGSPMQIMYAHLHEPPPSPRELNPQLSPALADVLLRGLAKKPEERFPSVSAFASAFQAQMRPRVEEQPGAFSTNLASSASSQAASGSASTPARGSDIRATLAISAIEAQTGAVRVIRLPDGRSLSVSIPPGARQGQVLTLEQQGERSARGGAAGSLYLTLSVAEPSMPPTALASGSAPTWQVIPQSVTPAPLTATQAVTPPGGNSDITPFPVPFQTVEQTNPPRPFQPYPEVFSGSYPSTPLTPPKPRRNSPLMVVGVISLVIIVLGAGILGSLWASAGHWPWSGGLVNGGTSSSLPQIGPAAQQVLRQALAEQDIASLDPALAQDSDTLQVVQMLFTGLVGFNDQGQVVDQLAQSHEVSVDGLTYTFHLRSSLRFSDGAPLTAADVGYSLDRALSPSVVANNAGIPTYLGLLKDASRRMQGQVPTLLGDSIMVSDPLTVSLVLSRPAAYFLNALASPSSFVIEKSLVDKWGEKWTDHLSDNAGQGGDGPFKVQSDDHHTSLVLVPNTSYYGPAPKLQRVVLDFSGTAAASYQAYQAGQVDLAPVPVVYDSQARQRGGEYRHDLASTVWYMTMNYLYKPFDNLDIRRAFALALNRDVLNTALSQNDVPTCHILPQGIPAYNPQLQCPAGAPMTGDATQARTLFAQGLQAEGLTVASFPHITLTYGSGSAGFDALVNAMVQSWRQVLGVNIALQALAFTSFVNAMDATVCTQSSLEACQNRGLAMWVSGWQEDYPDPQDWTTLQFDKDMPTNAQNYGQNLCSCAAEQRQVQQLLEHADVDSGSNRISLYRQAEQQLVNDVAWLPLLQATISYLHKLTLIGFNYNIVGAIAPDDWGHIYIAAKSN